MAKLPAKLPTQDPTQDSTRPTVTHQSTGRPRHRRPIAQPRRPGGGCSMRSVSQPGWRSFSTRSAQGWTAFRAAGACLVRPGYLFVGVGIYTGGYGILMAAWGAIMASQGVVLRPAAIVQGYLLSFLPRYIPGSVWGYLSRNEWLARYHGVGYGVATLTSFMEAGLLLLTAVTFAGVLLLSAPWNLVGRSDRYRRGLARLGAAAFPAATPHAKAPRKSPVGGPPPHSISSFGAYKARRCWPRTMRSATLPRWGWAKHRRFEPGVDRRLSGADRARRSGRARMDAVGALGRGRRDRVGPGPPTRRDRPRAAGHRRTHRLGNRAARNPASLVEQTQ